MSKLATAVSFAMAEPGRLVGQTAPSAEPDDIDADGEYEMDDVQYEQEPAVVDTPTMFNARSQGSAIRPGFYASTNSLLLSAL